jgi:1-acyl-sn-glycerol-3-phosphate acyltransferase
MQPKLAGVCRLLTVMSENQFALLTTRRFAPFFATQFLTAFNDNVFKNALVILLTYQTVAWMGLNSNTLVNLAAALFILPFFLFSASAGQLADKYEKRTLITLIKAAEVAIMGLALWGFAFDHLGALLICLFLMGTHSTFFGPIKYAILPQHLHRDELIGGNGLVESGTFLAILLGTMLGGALIAIADLGVWYVSWTTLGLALLGLIAARFIPLAAPPAPTLKFNWNLFSETFSNLRVLKANRTVFLSCLGISWFWFFGATFMTQLPNYTREVLGGSAQVVTLVLTIFSIGVGIGSLACEKLSGRRVEIGLVPFGAIGLTVFGIDLFFAHPQSAGALGLSATEFLRAPGGWRVAIDLLLIGVFGGFYIVPLFALIQQRSDAEYRSRIIAGNNILNAIFMVASAVMAIALLEGAKFSIPELLLTTALLNALVAIYIFSLVPEFLLRFLCWILICLMYRVRARGLEHIPDEGPAVLVANHVSFVDALVIGGMVRRPIRFVMYYKIFQLPILNWFFRIAKVIPIAGRKENPEMLAQAWESIDQVLAEGELICIFPEGQITRDGELNPFRPGVETVIARRPVPVIPLALSGLWGSVFSRRDDSLKRARIPRRIWSRVDLTIGEPIAPDAVEMDALREQVLVLRGSRA